MMKRADNSIFVDTNILVCYTLEDSELHSEANLKLNNLLEGGCNL
jgi:predicted nucleic acid-binding protein